MPLPYKYKPSYDVVNEYDWTSVPRRTPMRNEAPSVYITAYNLEYSQLRTFIDGYLNILSPSHFLEKGAAPSADPGLDFYKRLYGTSSTPITRLNLPFFTDNIRAFTTEFADTFSPVSQRGAQMLGGEFMTGLGAAGESVVGGAAALAGNIANIGSAAENSGNKSVMDKVSKAAIQGTNKAFNMAFGQDINFQQNEGLQTIGAPGTYIETPKFYQYGNTDAGLEISFALSNTLNDDGKQMNHQFIKDFTRMNRPYRTGSIGMTFPAIYNIVLPGQRYIQWAFLESFNINMIGMRRRIPLQGGGSEVVPEGYSCSFNFRSLTLEAANFLDEMDRYGDFEGGQNSYAALKRREEELMFEQQEASRAAYDKRKIRPRASSAGGVPRKPFVWEPTEPGDMSRITRPDGTPGTAGGLGFVPDADGNPPMYPDDMVFKGGIPRNPEDRSELEQTLAESYPELVEGSADWISQPGVVQDWRDKEKVIHSSNINVGPMNEPIIDQPDPGDHRYADWKHRHDRQHTHERRKGESPGDFSIRLARIRREDAAAARSGVEPPPSSGGGHVSGQLPHNNEPPPEFGGRDRPVFDP